MDAQPEMIESLDEKMSPEAVERAVTIFRRTRFGKRIADQGRGEGLNAGLGPVEHLYARRLGRPVTAAERAELLRRLDTLDPDRVGDVVRDLAPDALRLTGRHDCATVEACRHHTPHPRWRFRSTSRTCRRS